MDLVKNWADLNDRHPKRKNEKDGFAGDKIAKS